MPYLINQEEQEAKRASNKWIQPEEMMDTTRIQFKSLTEFAKGLGYDLFYPIARSFFSNDFYGNKGKEVIAFHTMVKLHNGYYCDIYHSDYFKPPFRFSTYKIRKAKAGKLVTICNLQINKKTGYIKASSNIVSFVHQEYEGFLDMKHL
jgi:hypothetical protein